MVDVYHEASIHEFLDGLLSGKITPGIVQVNELSTQSCATILRSSQQEISEEEDSEDIIAEVLKEEKEREARLLRIIQEEEEERKVKILI